MMDKEAFFAAVAEGNAVEIKRLLDGGMDVDSRDYMMALACAGSHGHTSVCNALLDWCANVEDKDVFDGTLFERPPFNYEVLRRYTDIMDLLLAQDNVGERDRNGIGALVLAAFYGRADFARVLLDKNGSMEARKDVTTTALALAAEGGRPDVANVLIDSGADMNAKSKSRFHNGGTALILAAKHGYKDVVNLLVNRGADMEATNENGETAIELAAKYGNADVVCALVGSGAKTGMKDENGKTLLMWAAQSGQAEIAQALVERGADMEEKDNCGRTALMLAADSGRAEVARVLLDSGADVEKKDNCGRTALAHAVKNKNTAVVSELVKSGVKSKSPFLRKSMRESLRKGDSEAVAAYCAAGIKPAPEDLRELPEKEFSSLEHGVMEFSVRKDGKWNGSAASGATMELAARVAAARVVGTEDELSVPERGAGALCDVLRKHRLTERINSIETAREAVLESAGKGNSPLPESPYYKAAEKYFSDVPNGDIVFEQIVKEVSATRKKAERSGRAAETSEWEPSL